MKYEILLNSDVKALVELINNRLRDGWELAGGVSTNTWGDDYTRYTQAIYHKDLLPDHFELEGGDAVRAELRSKVLKLLKTEALDNSEKGGGNTDIEIYRRIAVRMYEMIAKVREL